MEQAALGGEESIVSQTPLPSFANARCLVARLIASAGRVRRPGACHLLYRQLEENIYRDATLKVFVRAHSRQQLDAFIFPNLRSPIKAPSPMFVMVSQTRT